MFTAEQGVIGKVRQVAWLVTGLFLPLIQQISIAAIVALIFVQIFLDRVPGKWISLQNCKIIMLPVVFYLWHAAGLLWSVNMNYGLHDLETKMSFILIPLLIGLQRIPIHHKKIFFFAFTAGCIINALICLGRSAFLYAETSQVYHFFYVDYSFILHVAYFTIYISIACLFLFGYILRNNPGDKLLWFTVIFFLGIILILLDSRTAFITAIATWVLYLIAEGMTRHNVRIHSGTLGFLAAGFIACYFILFSIHNRFEEIKTIIEKKPGPEAVSAEPENYSNASIRPVLWQNAFEVFMSQPLTGVGTGDIRQELSAEYKASGFETGGNLNPHNQYLHTAVSLGIPGVFLLILMLAYPLILAIMQKHWMISAFLAVIILNSVTESVLEVQNGILFFSLVYSLLIPELCRVTNGQELPKS